MLPCAATALLVACLVGRWVFDADWGETVEDLAGDADGTLVGFVDDPRVTLDPGPSCPVALACAPAEATCDGSAVASCVDGSSLGVVRCELGCHEASAQCLLCEPGSHRCDAEIAAENKCAEDGLSWKLEEMCTTHCVEPLGRCAICVPGEALCSPNNSDHSVTCDQYGTGYSSAYNCRALTGQACNPATGECNF